MGNIQKKPGTPGYTRVEMTQVVMPQSTNTHGTVFGGQVMSWIDICAGVCAQRHCRTNVVTASFDQVHFLHPIKHGFVVILDAQVNAAFHTSMEIGTIVTAENPKNGERHIAVKAFCTFVALDDEDNPIPVPKLIVQSQEEKMREKQAKQRRKLRLTHKRMQEKELHEGII